MRDPAALTDDENWVGGFYQLAIEVGATDDQRLQTALSALWRVAGIDGCYGSPGLGSGELSEVDCTVSSLATVGHLKGTVVPPSGRRVVCGCFATRLEDGTDWLDFYLPYAALALVDRRIPRTGSSAESLLWRRPLDEWLAGIGAAIFREVPFRLGLIGPEPDGDISSGHLGGVAPEQRWVGFLVPTGEDLQFEPANR